MSGNLDEKLENNYDIFRINIKESYRVFYNNYQNLDRNFKSSLRKFRTKSLQIKRLEMDIQYKINNFFPKDKENKLVYYQVKQNSSINDEGTIVSTCDTVKKDSPTNKDIIHKKTYSKDDKISLCNRSKYKFNKEQKIALQKEIEIKDITENIKDYFQDEIQNLIKRKIKSKKSEAKPIKKKEEEVEDSSILSMFTSCKSRKKETKPEEETVVKKKEDDSSCLVF